MEESRISSYVYISIPINMQNVSVKGIKKPVGGKVVWNSNISDTWPIIYLFTFFYLLDALEFTSAVFLFIFSNQVRD